MESLLKKIINHVNNADPIIDAKFGFADPKKDGVSINMITQTQNIVSYRGVTKKIITFSVYCLYNTFVKSFEVSNNIYNYLIKHKIIDDTMSIVDVSGSSHVPYKSHRYLFVVEFTVLGFGL